MPAKKWTDEQKAEAMAVYASEGPAAAHLATGIPEGTIKSWAARTHGAQAERAGRNAAATVAAAERRHRAMQQRRASEEEARTAQLERLSVVAELALDRAIDMLTNPDFEVTPHEAMLTASRAIEKQQLLAGRPTSRHDWSAAEPEERRARIIELTADLERRAREAADREERTG